MTIDSTAAITATVTPAARKPHSTARVIPVKSVIDVLRGNRAMELLTSISLAFDALGGAKFAAKPFGEVKPQVSKNTVRVSNPAV